MKTIIKIFICLSLIYTPFFAFASAAEKWTIEEISYDNVAKNIKIQAEKNYGPSANDNTYKVKVPVTASATGSTAASMIRMGLAGAALYGLIEGVGWVIDNGSVVKKTESDISQIPNNQFYFRVQVQSGIFKYFDSESSARSYITSYANSKNYTSENGYTEITVPEPFSLTGHYGGVINGSVNTYQYIKRNPSFSSHAFHYWFIVNPDYNPEIKPEYEPVSDTELGQAIIASPAAPTIIPDIYNPNNPVSRPSPAPDLADKALENAPPTPKEEPIGDTQQKPNEDTDGDGQPDTFNPEKPSAGIQFTLPAFCSWAVTVCEWYTDWSDWSKDDSDLPENETLEIVEHVTPDLKEDAISWGAACPADVSIPISMQGVSSTLVFSWGPWCQLLSIIKPAIIASAYIGAAFIVLGLRT